MRVRDIQNVGQTPHDYIRSLLQHRNDVRLSKTAYAIVNDDDSVSVWLHHTEIVRAYRNGKTILRSGGWQTVTTKRYLNKLLPIRTYVSQKDFQWSVWTWESDVLVKPSSTDRIHLGAFSEGVTLTFNEYGRITGFREYMSDYAMRLVHEMASAFAFATDGPTDRDTVSDWLKGSDWGHLADSSLVAHVVEMATDMRAVGLRAA